MRHHRARSVLTFSTIVLALLGGGLSPASADHVSNPGPVNAQTTFGWGKPLWQDDFVGPMKSIWKVEGPGLVRTQVGMLTLNTATRGTVSARLTEHAARTGRWEIRLRQRRYSSQHANFRVLTELVPAGKREQNCGARNISLNNFALGSHRVRFYARNLPDLTFRTVKRRMNLSNDKWNTFAVEVRKHRVLWFVNSHVIVRERRAAAISGVPLTVKFTMEAVPGERMNVSRMQMDWLRYYTLQRPNSRSVAAPPATQAVNHDAC
ncbi:MAG: hypothetical protein WAW88_05720 [Nocardioides sp.]